MRENEQRIHIIQMEDELLSLVDDSQAVNANMAGAVEQQANLCVQQEELLKEIDSLAVQMKVLHESHMTATPMFSHLDCQLEDYYVQHNNAAKRLPELTPIEWIYASIAGLISVAIDVVFVGTPEVVKIYRGGEKFDGSMLTSVLRNIGTNPESRSYAVLHWLSEKCIVPYDLSAVKDVMYPNNHRVRSLAHDPFLGLFFAVADITLGTTTCIDNEGHLRVLLGKHEASNQEKMLAVFYYVGHIFSDICTARGIPVPGFFLTQFFKGDGTDNSIARKAEAMYLDGYDMRHLASASVSVVVKNLLIDVYLILLSGNDESKYGEISAEEISKQQAALKKEKMIFISDCIATGGNLAKVFLPPSCGNPASLNLAQWGQFIKSGIAAASAITRDMSVETVVTQRKDINDSWDSLLTGCQGTAPSQKL